MIQVRRAEKTDWPFIRELCCRTGNSGDPIETSRWPFFSEQWVGPYERLLPEWGYVAWAGPLRVGYLTGCPDTRAFEVKKFLRFELPLVARIRLLRDFPRTGETDRFVRRAMRREKGPEQSFSPAFLRTMKEAFPAHLHMNVEAFTRGMGAGRELIEAYQRDLRERGVRGIHLFCGDKPLPFYRKMGFVVLDTLEFRPGVIVYALGCKF